MGGQVATIAELLGTPLMPWQRLVADVGLEIDPVTGVFAYREVWFTVMRQSGKTSLALPWEVHRCVAPMWSGPQKVIYTAQDGSAAFKKLMNDQVPVLSRSPLGKLIRPEGGGRIRMSRDDPGVTFGTGSRIELLSSSKSSGHGVTVDLGVLDEAFDDEDDRREQALLPAMSTRPWAQILGYSTMGDDESVFLNRKVEVGREATLADTGSGVAYFEWSVPDDEDVDDPEVWWRYMPALGWTISEPAIAHARQTMPDGEWRRAYGNQRLSRTSARVFPAEAWRRVQHLKAAPFGDLRYGLDVLRGLDGHEDAASVAAFGGGHAEVVDRRPGLSWVVGRMVELTAARPGPVVLDGGGPAGTVADELEDAGVEVVRLKWGQVASACGRFYDMVADQKLRVRPDEGLDVAVAGVARKAVGDRFVWSRAGSRVDVTPLMAVTLACARSEAQEVRPFVAFD